MKRNTSEIDHEDTMDCAAQLRVLADETRLHIMRLLMEGSKIVGELNEVLDLRQSLLSHHLKVLREAGMVVAERNGREVRYCVSDNATRRGIDLGCCKVSFGS